MHSVRTILVIAVIVGHCSSCGQSEPLARVTGKVTFEGNPVREGLVVFNNEQLGVYMTAPILDGEYEIITARGKGVPPGEYRVAVAPPMVDHPVGPILEPPKPVEYADIPRRYHDVSTSGFTAGLQDGDNVVDLAMTKAK